MKSILLFLLVPFTILSCKKDKSVTNIDSGNGSVTSPINVGIDVAVIKNDIANQYRGINITENWEDQSYWNYPVSPAVTINAIKPNVIRAGNDDFFWSEAPYTSPKPRLIDYGPNEFYSAQKDLVESDGIHLKSRILDLDEFASLCNATGSEPEIIVPYNRIYYTGTVGSNVTTREDFLINAESMVRYANNVKGYNIKFWEIGNESWQSSTKVTAANYRDDLILFSKRMKAIDPTIKIIANGNSAGWFQTVLSGAAANIDYINVSYYPTYPYSGYNYYRTTDINYGYDGAIKEAIQAISSSGNAGKIKLIVTEFNAAGFGSAWKDNNDLGHALISFQIGANLMANPNIYFSSFWNLRRYFGNQPNGAHWLPTDTDPKTVFNAADEQGNLNPNGLGLSVLYNNVFGAMVDAQSDNQLIRPYACYDKSTGKMNIFLVNKDKSSQKVKLILKNITKVMGQGSVFSGNTDTDTKPAVTNLSDLSLTDNAALVSLNPMSVTLFSFK
jgi:hypothetical protein